MTAGPGRMRRSDDVPLRTAVLGGGVAGLGLAHGLAARSLPVQVLERFEPSPTEGFGFLLMPNGCRALAELGSEVDYRDVGVELRRAVIRTASGHLLSETPLDGVIGITRHALLSSLRQSIDRITPNVIGYGMGFEHFDWSGGLATAAVLDDGTSVSADLFCGADGIRSRCRAAIMDTPELRSGRVKEVVALAEDAALADELGDSFVKFVHPDGGLAVGLVPTGAGSIIWFVQFDSHRHEAPCSGAEGPFLDRCLVGFPDLVQAVHRATRRGTTHVWHTVDIDPVESMFVGNVALVGDAAHPLLPFTSQGANTALEDAAALVAMIERVSCGVETMTLGLHHYELVRRRDAVRFVAAGRRLAAEFVRPPEREFALPLAT